jgi:hypothetical protein
MEKKKRKRRWGDRREGRLLRSLDPYAKLMPFIMKTRSDSCNYLEDTVDITELEKYLRAKSKDGHRGLGLLHFLIAAYVRTASQYPAINRFVSGQRLYARDDIEFVIVIKRDLKIDSTETVLKIHFDPADTIYDVYKKFNAEIKRVVDEQEDTSTDNVANLISKLPRILLKIVVRSLELLDYFGKMPKAILQASPFHGSVIFTDVGSIGLPAIYHHLYNFGNLPLFISFGAKRRVNVIKDDGTVDKRRHVDLKFVLDERICDGFYFSQAYRYFKSVIRDPESLEAPPENIVDDIP